MVGFPAGVAPDIVARVIGQALSERLGQQFVIEKARSRCAALVATVRLLNHYSKDAALLLPGHRSGVSGTYNRAKYLAECETQHD
jgi:hypothetical protein